MPIGLLMGPPELNSRLFVLRLKSRRTQRTQEGTLALRSPGGWDQLHQGVGSHESPNSLPVPPGDTPEAPFLSFLSPEPSGFGLHLLPGSRDNSHCCLSQAWEEYDLPLAGASISVALFPCLPFSLKGEHEADPRWALFLLLTWAPLMEHLPQVPLVLAVTYRSTSGIFLS